LQARAAERSEILRTDWKNRKLVNWTAEQLVFVDESAANERSGHRKYGWAPIGMTPFEYRSIKRSERWSILPAYTIDGFIAWNIIQGSFTGDLFDDFIEFNLLPRCTPFPGPRSVIIMDNAPIHFSDVYPVFIIIADY
jgi:hypothetical protein